MNFAYRADIDGLRAIAILLVIFNHIGLSIFPGGYIGVDIFFVISGYLITLILSYIFWPLILLCFIKKSNRK